jgi:predicted HTH transcriptional regulator
MKLVHKYFNLKGIDVDDNNIISFAENASIITFDKDSNRYMVTLGGLLVFSDINSLYVPHNMIRIINKINKNFKENIIIQGNLLSMLDNCEDILKKILPKTYPVNGIFEGLRNAVLYRDYTLYYKEIEIILNYNSIMLISPGALMNGKNLNSSQYLKRNMWIYEKLITMDSEERFVNTGRGFFRMKRYFKGKGRLTFVNSIKENSFKIIYPGISLFK